MSSSTVLSRAPASLWKKYLTQLEKKPIQTKITTSVIAAILGDCLAQKSSRSKTLNSDDFKYDWARTARLCLFNGTMGCFGHFYYGALDARVLPQASKSAMAVVTKVGIDQLLFSPLCTAFFYLYKCAAEGRPGDFRKELNAKYWPTLIAAWKLWPAAHVVNFALVPTQQRILYANVVSVAGNYILSRAAAGDFNKSKEGTDGKERDQGGGQNEMLFDINVKIE